jgi:general secretion pathway protein B
LKKAQAERQIGETPTIHAPTLAPVTDARRAAGARKPLLVGAGLLGGAVVVMGAMLLRQPPSTPGASAPSAAATPAVPVPLGVTQPAPAAPVAAPPSLDAPLASVQPSAAAAVPVAATAQAGRATSPSAANQQSAAGSDAQARAGERPLAAASPKAHAEHAKADAGLPERKKSKREASDARAAAVSGAAAGGKATVAAGGNSPVPAPAQTQAPAQAQATAPAQATAQPEEHIQSMRDLPEPIQRAIPAIAMGGYMYSKNPADRLILIDKTLRKEGDEVAPGLQLEKLLPKAAVFSFRGYRYKVPL